MLGAGGGGVGGGGVESTGKLLGEINLSRHNQTSYNKVNKTENNNC